MSKNLIERQASAPDGYVLVPRICTDEMAKQAGGSNQAAQAVARIMWNVMCDIAGKPASAPNDAASEAVARHQQLAPCPFCGCELMRRSDRANPYARCVTEGCYGAKMPVVNLDDFESKNAWNKRAAVSVSAPREAPPTLTDSDLREFWKIAGGNFHGPNIETATIPEARLFDILRTLIGARTAENVVHDVQKPFPVAWDMTYAELFSEQYQKLRDAGKLRSYMSDAMHDCVKFFLDRDRP